MGKIKQINSKNWTYYFYNDQINLKKFDASMLKIEKRNYKDVDVYYIGYVTFQEIVNCNNMNSINPLYLVISEMIGHFEEKDRNKYLALDDLNENKEVSQKYEEVRNGINKEIETINDGKKIEYEKKIFKRFGSGLMMICQWINL